MVTNIPLTGLNKSKQKQNPAWFKKPSQLPRTNKVMDLGGLKTYNGHFTNPTWFPKYSLNVLRDKYSSHPLSRKLLFARDGDYYRKPQPSKCRVVKPVDTHTIWLLCLRLREHCEERTGRWILRLRGTSNGVFWDLLEGSETISTKSHQYDC